MQLSLSVASHRYVAQLTAQATSGSGSRPLILLASNAVVAASFSGPPTVGNVPTDQWLFEAITGISVDGRPAMAEGDGVAWSMAGKSIGQFVDALAGHIDEAFARGLIADEQLPLRIVFVGWQWRRRHALKARPVIYGIGKHRGIPTQAEHVRRHFGRGTSLMCEPPSAISPERRSRSVQELGHAPSPSATDSLLLGLVRDVLADQQMRTAGYLLLTRIFPPRDGVIEVAFFADDGSPIDPNPSTFAPWIISSSDCMGPMPRVAPFACRVGGWLVRDRAAPPVDVVRRLSSQSGAKVAEQHLVPTDSNPNPEPISQERCRAFAASVRVLVNLLSERGYKLNPTSRLPVALTLLELVASKRRSPSKPSDLIRISNAIDLAMLAPALSAAIRNGLPPSLRETTRRFLKGTLDDLGGTTSLQAQSELYQGMVLCAGGLKPFAFPASSKGRAPEYGLMLDNRKISVEVKRPSGPAGIIDNIREGIRQCGSVGADGYAILVDVSDCFAQPLCARVPDPDGADLVRRYMDAVIQQVHGSIQRLADREKGRLDLVVIWGEASVWTCPGTFPVNRAVFVCPPFGNQKLVEAYISGYRNLGGTIAANILLPEY